MTHSRSVLLAMDFQNGIVDRLSSPGVLAPAGRAVAAARAADVPVFFVRVAFRTGYPEIAETNQSFAAAKQHAGDTMIETGLGTQIHESLAPGAGEPIITKRRISAFTGSDLDVLLRGAGADTLVLSGISTSGVVLSTLRQAADLDYRIIVLEDACADTNATVHRVLMDEVFPRQATVTDTDSWISSLSA